MRASAAWASLTAWRLASPAFFCTLVQAVALNLMCQLGGLCAAHTRKATILQGEDVVRVAVTGFPISRCSMSAPNTVPKCLSVILAGDTAYVVFEAAAEALGLLLRIDVLTQRAAALPAAFLAMRRSQSLRTSSSLGVVSASHASCINCVLCWVHMRNVLIWTL
jgi:hypothetical protein